MDSADKVRKNDGQVPGRRSCHSRLGSFLLRTCSPSAYLHSFFCCQDLKHFSGAMHTLWSTGGVCAAMDRKEVWFWETRIRLTRPDSLVCLSLQDSSSDCVSMDEKIKSLVFVESRYSSTILVRNKYSSTAFVEKKCSSTAFVDF